ncbi:hypothetical protein CMUS01_15326 [Colletotrichum musicola]|uniref:Uncharacterized protein n=1 Tax=Colletotrichum musicola TaxID=2175873 RepID=A0A8H6IXG7_9PEZI|nr:hypothetical protein CMUS01_15326 [Colletotrichum musicola]
MAGHVPSPPRTTGAWQESDAQTAIRLAGSLHRGLPSLSLQPRSGARPTIGPLSKVVRWNRTRIGWRGRQHCSIVVWAIGRRERDALRAAGDTEVGLPVRPGAMSVAMANELFGLDKHDKEFRSRLWPWITTSARCASVVTCPMAEWRGEDPRQEFMCNGGEVQRLQPGQLSIGKMPRWMDGWDNKASSAEEQARDDNGGDVRGDRDGGGGSWPNPTALIACCLHQDDGTKGSRRSYSLIVLVPRPRLSDTENAAAVSTGSEAATPWCPMPSRLGHLIDNPYEGRSHSLLTGWENLDPFAGRNPKRVRRPGSKSTIISAVAVSCGQSSEPAQTPTNVGAIGQFCERYGYGTDPPTHGPRLNHSSKLRQLGRRSRDAAANLRRARRAEQTDIHEPVGDGPSADVSRQAKGLNFSIPSVTARRSLKRRPVTSLCRLKERGRGAAQRRAQEDWTKRSLCRVVGVSLRQPESSRGAM